MANPGLYTVGGTVQAGGGIYIPRAADQELLQLCRDRVFAYVLTPRQMGKSSLMVQTAERLQAEGVRTAIVDLQDLGAQVTAEQWYFGFLVKLEDQLELDTDVVSWWRDRSHLGVSQRLTLFFERVLLREIAEPIVVFVDEIDSTLSLDFTDDFFIAIRSLYTTRATQPEFQRLSFVLIGVATPGDLIRDPQRTPFNIGQKVELKGFRLNEAQPLAVGLIDKIENPLAALEVILGWTGGQPFLTQKICNLLLTVETDPKEDETEQINKLVQSHIIENWEVHDEPEHLRTIRARLLHDKKIAWQLLILYRQILQEVEISTDTSSKKMELKLSGLVVEQNGELNVYNRIYETVFDQKWIEQELFDLQPDSQVRLIFEEITHALREGRRLKDIDTRDPYYVNQFPYIWMQKYSWCSESSRIPEHLNLTLKEKQQIEKQLPNNLPKVQLIDSSQFTELIEFLHSRIVPQDQGQSLSKDDSEYIKHRLILSGTVQEIEYSHDLICYVLVRESYTPSDDKERLHVAVEEAARYFRMLKNWQERNPDTLRIMESLDIPPEQLHQALAELDEIIRLWANKYHHDGGTYMILQVMLGLGDE